MRPNDELPAPHRRTFRPAFTEKELLRVDPGANDVDHQRKSRMLSLLLSFCGRYALLQTPEFIEEFILDRTLTPAIETFGYQHVRMIDPTCGSAHFLLGGFHRLFALHQRNHPAVEVRALAQRALDQVFGVDLNPNVVAIARFRLLLAALKVSGVEKLKDAPAFQINVGTGDTLLHGPGQTYLPGTMGDVQHHYESEDAQLVSHILGQRYHAVVGNPPYITVKDKALNQLYRERFLSCSGKYSLSVPFMECFFGLAVQGDCNPQQPAGFVGQITANSFMKATFGAALVEDFIPRWDITHIIDTSGAHIPEHGTPTLILFGRNQSPVAPTIRCVMGIEDEPEIPANPAKGLVWTAILAQVDIAGSESPYLSVTDTPRERFAKHPWSIGGGGVVGVKQQIEDVAVKTLQDAVTDIGIGVVTLEDEAFSDVGIGCAKHRFSEGERAAFVEGDCVRDWVISGTVKAVFPYPNWNGIPALTAPALQALWPLRANLRNRIWFRKTQDERGYLWFAYGHVSWDKFSTPLSIVFAFVSTHNHFVLDEERKVYNRPAPVIKLSPDASVADHLRLLGVLNSSTGCFWMKQVCQPKGGSGIGRGVQNEAWEDRYSFNTGQMAEFPIPEIQPTQLPTSLVQTSTTLQAQSPTATLASWSGTIGNPLRTRLDTARNEATRLRWQLIAWQEELDWEIYEAFGLVATADAVSQPEGQVAIPPEGLELGQRAFEIVLARRMAAGEVRTTWFQRHGSTPITDLPSHWPEPYRQLVEKRIQLIESDRNIRLIEQPEYKRRWNTEPWEEQQERALREWLLNRLEEALSGVSLTSSNDKETGRRGDGETSKSPSPPVALSPRQLELTTCAHLADKVRRDAEFMTVANLYRNRTDYDLTELVVELVESEAVPFLPVLRYKPSGLRKREVWEQTWAKQREEDAIDARTQLPEGDPNRITAMEAKTLKQQTIGDIPVPPKYETKDFLETTFWRLRGKLDVPKERFIAYPFCNRDADRTPVIGWAGWDHLQQAQAVAGYYERMRTNEGWSDERLLPLLAGVLELLPWLIQWHNALDPQYGMGLGDFFRSFVEEEARRMGKTLDEVRAWQPPAKPGRKKKGGS